MILILGAGFAIPQIVISPLGRKFCRESQFWGQQVSNPSHRERIKENQPKITLDLELSIRLETCIGLGVLHRFSYSPYKRSGLQLVSYPEFLLLCDTVVEVPQIVCTRWPLHSRTLKPICLYAITVFHLFHVHVFFGRDLDFLNHLVCCS